MNSRSADVGTSRVRIDLPNFSTGRHKPIFRSAWHQSGSIRLH
jgi:hypothetical protein